MGRWAVHALVPNTDDPTGEALAEAPEIQKRAPVGAADGSGGGVEEGHTTRRRETMRVNKYGVPMLTS